MANELQARTGTALQLRSDADEARELVRLAFEEAAGAFDGLHAIHGSIAERAFRRTGPGGAPAHWMHDRIVGAVFHQSNPAELSAAHAEARIQVGAAPGVRLRPNKVVKGQGRIGRVGVAIGVVAVQRQGRIVLGKRLCRCGKPFMGQ